jgi:hypothetical protein
MGWRQTKLKNPCLSHPSTEKRARRSTRRILQVHLGVLFFHFLLSCVDAHAVGDETGPTGCRPLSWFLRVLRGESRPEAPSETRTLLSGVLSPSPPEAPEAQNPREAITPPERRTNHPDPAPRLTQERRTSSPPGNSVSSLEPASREFNERPASNLLPPTLLPEEHLERTSILGERRSSAVSLPPSRLILDVAGSTSSSIENPSDNYVAPFDSPADVYYTGWGIASPSTPSLLMRLPTRVSVEFAGGPYRISQIPSAFRARQSIAHPAHWSQQATLISQGLQSEAFWLHHEVPESILAQARALGVGSPEAQDLISDWIRFHAVKVVKVARVELTDSPEAEAREVQRRASLTRRDLIMNQVATQLLADARLPLSTDPEGRPLLRVAEILSHPEDVERGLLVQDAAHGHTLFEIQNAMDRLTPATARHPRLATLSERRARQILLNSRVDVPGGFALMRLRIAAIEEAYRRVHTAALRAQRATNTLLDLRNDTRGAYPGPIGLDYNHGQNVIWDPHAQIGVVIDR